MEKRKYYVSIQSRSILADQGLAAYELEIEATEAEAAKLRTLFDDMEEADHAAYFRSLTPGLPYHHDLPNDAYDALLKDCYALIYELGTPKTQAFLSTIEADLGGIGRLDGGET